MLALLAFLMVVVPLGYFYLTRSHAYWKNQGVAFIPPLPILGNLKPLIMLDQSPGTFLGALYNAPVALKERFVGMFIFNSQPALLLRDPELIKQIYVKNFNHFNNRNVECDPVNDPIGHHNLFVLRDEKWKYLRSKLTPTFTSGKIKQMFRLILGVVDELLINIDNRIEKNEPEIEIKELAAKYTTDVISTCAFGIQSNSLNNPNALFRKFGKLIFEMSIRRALEVRSFFFMHWFARATNAYFITKASSAFFRKVFWEAMETRETQGIVRNDFLDTLIQLKNDAKKKLDENQDKKEVFEFDGDFLVAQSVLFFTAGFETTATTISNTLAELAFAPDIQEKLRQEINESFESHNGQLTYEGLFEMKYLDKVISEVLRKYPPMPFIDRVCTQDFQIPDSDVVIKKGTPVFVSMFKGLHYDPEYFPDPERFDPERFSEENKSTRHPFSYIPFGEGPHICIGMRFALMNVKTAISMLLKKYRVEKTSGLQMPFKMDERAIILTLDGALPLKFITL